MMEPFFVSLTDAMKEIMELLQATARKELEQQGHVLTGRLRDSIDYEITPLDDKVVGTLFGDDYGVVVEFGVDPERIPFSDPSGRGGTSKYIQGLVRFFQIKGLDEREAIRAAFATARIHKREGMPTVASSRFSQTGKRIGFIKDSVDALFDKFITIIEGRQNLQLQIEIGNQLKFEPLKLF